MGSTCQGCIRLEAQVQSLLNRVDQGRVSEGLYQLRTDDLINARELAGVEGDVSAVELVQQLLDRVGAE